jgi:hypothetical protein
MGYVMDWKSEIPGCFGAKDGLFAVHPLEAQRAAELLSKLCKERVGWEDVRASFITFLSQQGWSEDHIAEQIVRIEERFKAWLA